MSDKSNSFARWLGRQVGHVVRAVREPLGRKVIYRDEQTAEQNHPEHENVKLRRTVIDEVIVEPPEKRS